MARFHGSVAALYVYSLRVVCPKCGDEIRCENDERPDECDQLHGKVKCPNGHTVHVPDTSRAVGQRVEAKAPMRKVVSRDEHLARLECGHSCDVSVRTRNLTQRACRWCLLGGNP